jgi:hypothetical protein
MEFLTRNFSNKHQVALCPAIHLTFRAINLIILLLFLDKKRKETIT